MKYLLTLTCVMVFSLAQAQNNSYKASIDLSDVVDDKLLVKVQPPSLDTDTVEYHMPKIVPGTYSISDFGRFVTEFKAIDSSGNELEFEKISTNKWKIYGAKALREISYRADDTFDKTEGYEENIVFEPGGTNIEAERDVFVLNTFGVVGYIKGEKFRKYELTITHDEKLYGATSLKRSASSKTSDTFVADNYNFLADAPIMYCEPDTVTRNIAGAEIIISVFSPNKILSAREVMDNVDDLMEAQTNYLGGKLPVDRYAYLIYLMDYSSLSNAMGALEHSYSSLYTLPEANADQLSKTVRDVAAHEFLHIVTPLNIHSEQIHNFNYIEPEMSRHLWLYEGVTEYSSMHVQVRHDLYDGETFLDEIKQKLQVADQFPNVSFTEMSSKILEPAYEPMYSNVYYKGALIGMCLDLYLIKYTDGKMDLPTLMRTLAQKYGPNQAFEDDKLIDEITKMTATEIGDFFEKHVEGSEPLPIQKCLSWAGIDYKPEETIIVNTVGNIGLDVDDDQNIIVASTDEMNDFGKDMGFVTYDIIKSVNGDEFNLQTAGDILNAWRYDFKEGKKIKIVVLRMVEGEQKEIKLKAKAQTVETEERHILTFMESPSEEQEEVKKYWLEGLE